MRGPFGVRVVNPRMVSPSADMCAGRTARAIPSWASSTDLLGDVRDREGDPPGGELRYHEIRRKFLGSEDPGAREAFRVDHDDGDRRRRCGEEAFRGDRKSRRVGIEG